jgi:hypothetical protein
MSAIKVKFAEDYFLRESTFCEFYAGFVAFLCIGFKHNTTRIDNFLLFFMRPVLL